MPYLKIVYMLIGRGELCLNIFSKTQIQFEFQTTIEACFNVVYFKLISDVEAALQVERVLAA